MSACSDQTYEPGPVAALDLGDFDGTLEPPFATPIAQSFADQSTGWLSTLDASFAALAAEQVFDVGGDVLGAVGAFPTGSSASVNAEANAHLVEAEQGLEAARGSVVEVKSWLPPDIVAGTGPLQATTITRFTVVDAAAAPVAGATVTIDVDTGHGTTQITDAAGQTASFIVPTVSIVGYTVTAAGHAPISGVFNTYTDRAVTVTVL